MLGALPAAGAACAHPASPKVICDEPVDAMACGNESLFK
jgi:hypothetical protein